MMEMGASVLIFIGSFFVFSAAVGLVRMPDSVSRIQTGTKATTLGACLILAGLAILSPEQAGQYVLLIVFVFISNPISSHALARAGLRLDESEESQETPEQSESTAK